MARLVVIQQPQETFHKDEGGKSNNLAFRVVLQGDVDPSIGGAKGEVPLDVIAVYEDGTPVPKQDQIISITGCTEKPSGGPCVCLVSRLGGVLYRLKRVSKRLDDRAVCVRVSLRGCPDVPAVQSSGTMVFSKRKNKEQREEEQAREREEMEKREAEVATLLVRGQVSGSGSERPSKMSRMDASNYDTDDSSSIQLNSGVIEELLRRVSDLEHTVAEQQKLIDEMRNVPTAPPPMGLRSTSQALWNIPSNIGPIGTFMFAPPMLKRDTSCESFPEMPVLVGH